ncbi:serine/threonine-protein kinase [Saccharopolyspora spinosa]|uniref:non-specific serine/threonine protein kinase n=1 Tax=Saccharopolyspora spinosa TaxID=60894 RepID=A0A2N3Y808_SACSN|nr:serine/threonine-protein kinase [Saccharopolyspora spinosa]PKW19064.1 serine/threonine protein kinase [Saccharopolyspora spinosa]
MTAISTAPEPTESAPEPYPPGDEITPGYRVIQHIRRGQELDTYDAWSEKRYCRCFIKSVRPDLAHHEGVRERLELEGRLLLSFTHPHIVRAYDLVGGEHGPVVVLETLSGATLSHLVETRTRRLTAAELAHLGQHLCSAMAYMHDHGYLHLDLNPGNIIADMGRARVIDLNFARQPGPSRGGAGTPCAMSPEQIRGGMLSQETDVWGIGLVLYGAATGIQPFDVGTSGERRDTIVLDEPTNFESESVSALQARCPQLTVPAPPIRTQRRLPKAMSTAIDACLRQDPQQRPTVAELAEALSAVADPVPTPGAESSRPVHR